MGASCTVACSAEEEIAAGTVQDSGSPSAVTSGETSLTTVTDFSLFENQPAKTYYVTKINQVGKIGAVRDWIQDAESAGICWLAFAKHHRYMYSEELFDFFKHLVMFTSQMQDIRVSSFYKQRPHVMYQDFVVRVFGRPKTRLNQREFWVVADLLQARFNMETSCGSDDSLNVVYYRKQSLAKAFHRSEKNIGKIGLVMFKLFAGNENVINIDEFHDLVHHTVMTFADKESVELERSTELWSVISEMVIECLDGEKVMELNSQCFLVALEKLRGLFVQLRDQLKVREECTAGKEQESLSFSQSSNSTISSNQGSDRVLKEEFDLQGYYVPRKLKKTTTHKSQESAVQAQSFLNEQGV